MENQEKELTFGQKSVAVSFNPSKDSKVDKVKQLIAEVIDIINDHKGEIVKPTWLQNVLFTQAFNCLIMASMSAVKFLTWKEGE